MIDTHSRMPGAEDVLLHQFADEIIGLGEALNHPDPNDSPENLLNHCADQLARIREDSRLPRPADQHQAVAEALRDPETRVVGMLSMAPQPAYSDLTYTFWRDSEAGAQTPTPTVYYAHTERTQNGEQLYAGVLSSADARRVVERANVQLQRLRDGEESGDQDALLLDDLLIDGDRRAKWERNSVDSSVAVIPAVSRSDAQAESAPAGLPDPEEHRRKAMTQYYNRMRRTDWQRRSSRH